MNRLLLPPGWPTPKGYANGVAARGTLVSIAGQSVRALIDSGAQYSVIDAGLFDALGLTKAFDLPLLAYGVGGRAQMG